MGRLILLFLCLCRCGVQALPGFSAFFPNGNAVPCPPGVSGCQAGICTGVGHTSCAGGGGLNAFGRAFNAAGHKWTRALCLADSDGDGIANGVELGDPCCVWSPGQTPRFPAASHPGLSSSTSVAAPRCAAAPVPATAPAPTPGLATAPAPAPAPSMDAREMAQVSPPSRLAAPEANITAPPAHITAPPARAASGPSNAPAVLPPYPQPPAQNGARGANLATLLSCGFGAAILLALML